eukprot:scaffold178700_cov35-Prasinocladus_malaysianus.AAC.1
MGQTATGYWHESDLSVLAHDALLCDVRAISLIEIRGGRVIVRPCRCQRDVLKSWSSRSVIEVVDA